MALTITENKITGSGTRHTAILVGYTGAEEGTGWRVSWLPGRLLDSNQAVTAMMIAEMCAGGIEPGSVRWVQVAGWAGELCVAAGDAVRLAAEPPE